MLAGRLKSCGYAKTQLDYVTVECFNILCPLAGSFSGVPNGILCIKSEIIPLRFSLLSTFSYMFSSHMDIQGLLKVPDFDSEICNLLALLSILGHIPDLGELFLFLGFFDAHWPTFSGIGNALTKSVHVSHWNSADRKDFSWFSSMQHKIPTTLPVWKCSVTHFSLLWQKRVPGHSLCRWPLLSNKDCQ